MIDIKDDMSPIVTVMADLTKAGYVTQFQVTDKGLHSTASQKCYKPKQVDIKHFYRFEGDSDPGDNSILYAIETQDGEKGTLIDSYGAECDPLISKFIKQVESIHK